MSSGSLKPKQRYRRSLTQGDRDFILAGAAEGLTSGQMAKTKGLNHSTVSWFMRVNGFVKQCRHFDYRITHPSLIECIKLLHLRGHSGPEISELLKLHRTTVYNWLRIIKLETK